MTSEENNKTSQNGSNGLGSKEEKPKQKRFYETVDVAAKEGAYNITLDSRPIKTPLKQLLAVKQKPMAEAIANEWRAQETHIDHQTMLMTKLANTAIDRVRTAKSDILAEIISYANSDLICYRATDPETLVKAEAEQWNPIIEWLKSDHEIEINVASGIIHQDQPAETLAKVHDLASIYDEFALTALHNMTTIIGSAFLTLALVHKKWPLEAIWTAAHVDENHQIKQWGEDEEAAIRRKARWAEFEQTAGFFELAT